MLTVEASGVSLVAKEETDAGADGRDGALRIRRAAASVRDCTVTLNFWVAGRWGISTAVAVATLPAME